MSWTQVEPKVEAAGSIGGDIQVGEAWGQRFTRPLDSGQFAVVEVNYYLANQRDQDDEAYADGFYVQEQTQLLICTDADDPGGTELWSDYEYEDFDGTTEEAARGWAERFSINHISWEPR